jgi:transcription elongation factor GreB
MPTEFLEKTNLITPAGYEALVSEVNTLVKVERPRIVEEVYHAAKQGDRSENAEYQYGKKRLREIDRRVRFLSKRLEIARIIDPKQQQRDCVRFGCKVTTMNHNDGKSKIYTIVGEDEINTSKLFISWLSPVGKGLLKAKIGDFVDIETPAGTLTLEITNIDY